MANIIYLKSTDTYTTIQNALKKSGYTIVFEAGTYKPTKTFMLYSNTNVVMQHGAVFQRTTRIPIFQTYVTADTTGYNGQHDITIHGGTISSDSCKSFGNLFNVIHAKNVTIQEFTFEDIPGSHAIEINASKNIHVINCTFRGYYPNKDGAYREAIQIDFANYTALGYEKNKNAKCYDLTHCEDIFIQGCSFVPSTANQAPTNAIGTHTVTTGDKCHSNIQIVNNFCYGRGEYNGYGIAFCIENMDNVLIKNNLCKNYGRFCRIITPSKYYNPDGSTITTENIKSGSENIIISGNIFEGAGTLKAGFVYINNTTNTYHKNIIITDNIFKRGTNNVVCYGVYSKNVDAIISAHNIFELNKGGVSFNNVNSIYVQTSDYIRSNGDE